MQQLQQYHLVNFIQWKLSKQIYLEQKRNSAIENKVNKVVCLSTDKAVYQLMQWEFQKL